MQSNSDRLVRRFGRKKGKIRRIVTLRQTLLDLWHKKAHGEARHKNAVDTTGKEEKPGGRTKRNNNNEVLVFVITRLSFAERKGTDTKQEHSKNESPKLGRCSNILAKCQLFMRGFMDQHSL